MAGRNYIPPNELKFRQDPNPNLHPHPYPPRVLIESPPPRHHHVDDRIAVQQREIQSLLMDNQRLAATHVALKQELAIALQDLRHLSTAAGNVKAERDAQVREVYERAVKMEAEARLVDELGAELAQVRSDVQKLNLERKELTEKLDKVHADVAKERSKGHQIPLIKADIEAMQKEIQRGRAAIEYEKKVYASNLEQSQAMEKNMISMAHEIEKLQAELANADKRARASAAAAAAATPGTGYVAAGYGNPEMMYGGNAYPNPYAGYQVQGGVGPQYGHGPGPGATPPGSGPYDMHHHPQYGPGQGQGPGPGPHGAYDTQHPNVYG